MTPDIPTALIAYLQNRESLLWQAILKLQRVDVVVKKHLDNIYAYLRTTTPQLLLIDYGAQTENTLICGSVCRWAQSHMKELQIFIVNPLHPQVTELERRWAIRRGAVDFLPKLTTQNALDSIGKVLTTIGQEVDEYVMPTIFSLIAKYNPEPSEETMPEEGRKEQEEETEVQAQKEDYIIYRGVKVPRFSVAAHKHSQIVYRGISYQPKQGD
ncbi:MAG: hypothetical protein ACK421_04680 [Pseudanabaenaceae cyanobacterium]